jgi:hypothetical protein
MTYRPIAIGGDWNARRTNPDKYRPRWLARTTRLVIPDGADGIDYVMSDATVTDVRRLPRRGSDHQPKVMRVEWSGHDLMLGTWNLLVKRDPDVVAAEVVAVCDDAQLDVLLVQEVGPGYASAIRRQGLIVVGEGQQRIVVRPGVSHTGVRHHRLSRAGWPVSGGRWHAPATATSCRVAGWLRVVSVHLPNYERSRWHDLAYRQCATRLGRYTRRRRRRLT